MFAWMSAKAFIIWERSYIMNKRIGKNDVIFVIVIFAIALFIMICFSVFHKDVGDTVKVTVDGKIYGTYSLNRDETVEIIDDVGKITNILMIEANHADIVSADCPDELCVKQAAISHNGETIVCLPNKVVVSIEGKAESDIDSISK